MVGRLDFTLKLGKSGAGTARQTGEPLQILILGGFSGTSPAHDGPFRVNVDNFEQVLSGLAPALSIDHTDHGALTLEFRSLDDFHPDRLLDQLPECQRLMALRQRLENPRTYKDAAREISAVSEDDSSTTEGSMGEGPAPANPDQSAFDQLIGKSATQPDVRTDSGPSRDRIAGIIRDIVAPHLEAGVDDRQPQFLAAVDEMLATLLRQVLHAPAFQQLESTWRGLHWLVTSIYDEENVRLQIINVDLGPGQSVDDLATRLIAEADTPGGPNWSLIVTNATFGDSVDSIAALADVGALAAGLGAPVIGAASPRLLGREDFSQGAEVGAPGDAELAEAWAALQASPVADWIGLTLPRFLVRQPYGKGSDEIDRFAFEELPPRPAHEAFPWANAAFICARLVTNAFQEAGWDFASTLTMEPDDLPLVIYNDGTGRAIKPVAECLISESAGLALVGAGFITVLSFRDQNRARVQQLRSIGPGAHLTGITT
jgi:type VI secretion system protein ImpC